MIQNRNIRALPSNTFNGAIAGAQRSPYKSSRPGDVQQALRPIGERARPGSSYVARSMNPQQFQDKYNLVQTALKNIGMPNTSEIRRIRPTSAG